MDYCPVIPGFGRHMGESITIPRAASLTQQSSSVLSEVDRIPVSDFTLSTSSITLYEYGRAVTFTHMAQLLSKVDPEDPIQQALKDNMTKSLDLAIFAAMKTVYLFYVPTSSTGGSFNTTTVSSTALVNLNSTHMGLIRDGLKSTYTVPPYEGNDYIGLLSTKALRGLKSDDDFVTWKQYLREGDVLHNSEVGKIENIKCVEVSDTDCLTATGTGSCLGQGIIFGRDFAAMVEAETPEIRVERNVGQDFGRKHAAGWYGIVGFGLKFPTTSSAGLVKGCYITSA